MMNLQTVELRNVLIVDDEPDICLLLRKILVKMNLIVDYAYSIGDGLKKVVKMDPELVFLDMNLTDGNGLDHISEFKQNKKATIIVMISAYDTAADRAKAFELGVNYFLSKPFTQMQIAEVITELKAALKKPKNG